MDFSFILILLVPIGFAIWVISKFNRLVGLHQEVKRRNGDIEAETNKRKGLVEKLWQIAQEAAGSEHATQIMVTQQESQNLGDVQGAFVQMARAYPALKANEQYGNLMTQLGEVEKDLSVSRREYNEAVGKYNTYRNSFPTVMIAPRLGFEEAPYFKDESDDWRDAEFFTVDQTEVVSERLSELGRSIGESSRKLGSGVKAASKEIAAQTKEKMEESQRRAEVADSSIDKKSDEPSDSSRSAEPQDKT